MRDGRAFATCTLALSLSLLTACQCGSTPSSDAGRDAGGDTSSPDLASRDRGVDRSLVDGCGKSRTLTPEPFPGVALPNPPTPCGPGCRQVEHGGVDNRFELEGDVIVGYIHAIKGFRIIYSRISSGKTWRLHGEFGHDFDGCRSGASDGKSLYYLCTYGTTAEKGLGDVVITRYDPETQLETDAYCFTPGTSQSVTELALGSTGVLVGHVFDPSVCNKNDAVFYRFETQKLENLSENCGSVFYTQMAGPYAVWSEGNGATLAMNIALYDTRTGEKIFVSPSPRAQFMPRTDGRYVVWADSRNDPNSSFYGWANSDLYRYDILTQKVELVTDHPAQQIYPDVSGKWVAWEDARNGRTDIYAKDMDTGKVYQLSNQRAKDGVGGYELQPRVDNGRVLYRMLDNNNRSGLFLVDLKAFVAAGGLP